MSKGEARGGPIKFRVMGFKPIHAKDNVVCANRGDVKFGVFLVEMIGRVRDANVLNHSVTDRAILVGRAINISYLERHAESVEREIVLSSKRRIDNHSFSTTVKKGVGTDFSTRGLTDKRDRE